MKTTFFRPSIHGWPFGNSWKYSFAFDTVTLTMGYCGGMCWRALQRFYNGIPIPRDIQAPGQGDALYEEIFDAQVNSVPAGTLWKIYDWQCSPDLSHRLNPLHSLGHRTQEAWPDVRNRLDESRPVTLTLVASSNDANLKHLEDSHRVVAYAYDVRPILEGEGAPSGADSQVTVFVYDPNYPNDDGVCLTFYLGAESSKIQLRHSRGKEFHGFFLDDKDRDYASAESTAVWINQCVQTGISSATRADHDLQFSWKCRFVPYFCVQVDGINWNYNSVAQSSYEPKTKPDGSGSFVDKQCPSRTGSMTVKLQLPRDRSVVAVRLLDADAYYQALEVDAQPGFECYPYIRSRATGDGPQICDYDIRDADLFVKEPEPTEAAVQQVDLSPFRWVIHVEEHQPVDTRRPVDDLSKAYVEVIDRYRLGNVAVPILANFAEKNLAPPVQASGVVKTVKNGQTVRTVDLASLAGQAQRIFDGFRNNPADYDEDTTVEFTYTARDRFGVVVQGQATFHGRSIIYHQYTVTVYAFDPDKVAKLEAVARDLIERGLIDIAIELPHTGPRPRPTPDDSVELLQKLRTDGQLQASIDQTFARLWRDSRIWQQVWTAQSEILEGVDDGRAILIDGQTQAGDVLKVTHELREVEQRKFEAVTARVCADGTIGILRRNPHVIDLLKSL